MKPQYLLIPHPRGPPQHHYVGQVCRQKFNLSVIKKLDIYKPQYCVVETFSIDKKYGPGISKFFFCNLKS